MVENVVFGIFQTLPQGRYLSANLALARLYGYDSADELIAQLNDVGRQLYGEAERRSELIAAIQQQETIKTMGYAYLVVGGVPTPRADHAGAIVNLALAMQQAIGQWAIEGEGLKLRIGIATGAVLAGVTHWL